MNAKEAASDIRATLKKQHGWTSKQVSVVSDVYSMGSTVRVMIKDPAVNIEDVKAVAEPHESIRRCEMTGDILSGGNMYIHVNYSSEAMDIRKNRYLPAVLKAIEERAQHGESSLIPIEGTKYLVGTTPYGLLSLWSDSFLCQANNAESIAREIACRLRA